MQQLIEQLFAGTIEYKDDQIIRHPPNSVMLQAGRVLQQVHTSLETNQILINQLQTHQDEHLATIQQLRVEIGNLTNELSAIKHSQSLRDSQQKTSDVGSDNGEPSGSDSDRQGSGTN